MATEAKTGSAIVETLKTVFWALIIAGIFRTILFQPFWIPSGSMKDTLLVGDFLFVNKLAYGYSYASCPTVRIPAVGIDVDAKDICGWLDGDNTRLMGGEPERGDIIVFRHPVNGTDFIKRLIGLPGDKIQMKDGVLHINDAPSKLEDAGTFDEIYAPQGPMGVRPRCSSGAVGVGATCSKQKLRRNLSRWAQPLHPECWRSTLGQDRCLYRARRPLLLYGRQSRQFHRQPLSAGRGRGWVCALRKPDRSRRPGDVLVLGQIHAVFLDMAQRPVLQGVRVSTAPHSFSALMGIAGSRGSNEAVG